MSTVVISLSTSLYQYLSSLHQQLSLLDICLVIPRRPLHAHRRTPKHNFPRTRATALVCGISTHLSIVTGQTAPTALFSFIPHHVFSPLYFCGPWLDGLCGCQSQSCQSSSKPRFASYLMILMRCNVATGYCCGSASGYCSGSAQGASIRWAIWL